MSDAPDDRGAFLHINRGVNVRYCARVRLAKHRKWTPVTKWIPSRKAASRAMCDAMEGNAMLKRGQVLHIADYYDPTVVLEMKR